MGQAHERSRQSSRLVGNIGKGKHKTAFQKTGTPEDEAKEMKDDLDKAIGGTARASAAKGEGAEKDDKDEKPEKSPQK